MSKPQESSLKPGLCKSDIGAEFRGWPKRQREWSEV